MQHHLHPEDQRVPCLWRDTVFPFRFAVWFFGFWRPAGAYSVGSPSLYARSQKSCTQEVVDLPPVAYSVGRPTLDARTGRPTTSC